MIQQTFLHLPGVSERSERNIHLQGITSWDDFLKAKEVRGFSHVRKQRMDDQIKEALSALHREEYHYFKNRLTQPHLWRMYEHCKDSVLYLDIETSGFYGDVTVIGMFDGINTKTLVNGFNLDKQTFFQILAQYDLLVTFNGASFDIPVLERYFGKEIPHLHLDLRHSCARLGLKGGLKVIEKEIGIKRPDELSTLHGADAVYLWQMWKSTGEKEYLDTLVAYNEEDIVNLLPLAEHVVRENKKRHQMSLSFSCNST
jgi:uncharacterized protein